MAVAVSDREKLVHNERMKLLAAHLNGVSINFFIAGTITFLLATLGGPLHNLPVAFGNAIWGLCTFGWIACGVAAQMVTGWLK